MAFLPDLEAYVKRPSFGTALLALALLTAGYWLTVIIYNVKFHPLADYPGPISRAAFHFPGQCSEFSGNEIRHLKSLHDKYGDVVRIYPDALSFISPQAAKDIYGPTKHKEQIPKDLSYYGNFTDGGPNLTNVNDADHTRIRASLAPAFSMTALKDQEAILTHYFDLLVTQLRNQIHKTGGEVDFVRWYNFTTFDIVADLCFGESFGALEKGEYHPWVSNIFKGIKFTRFMRFGLKYPLLGKILDAAMSLFPSIAKARSDHLLYSIQKTEKRLEMVTKRKDIMTQAQHDIGQGNITRAEISNTSSFLIIGGSDTTTSLLSGATYYLLMNPSKLKRAQDEVRSAFSAGRKMTVSTTSQLKYLHAVLQESMRMYPPVPILLPRRTTGEGKIIDGRYVPKNVTVGFHHYAAYRSPRHFANPDTFVPERWLDDPPSEYKNDNKAVLLPFLLGPRNCIGPNLAWAEAYSIMTRMLKNFDMEFCDESREWDSQKVFSLWDKKSLKIRLSTAGVKS